MSVIARTASTRRLGVLWCAYDFLDDFVLLYALETLLFLDTGLSTAEITSLLIAWSLTSVLLEVPSGVLADIVPRRALIAVAPLLRAAAFGLWVITPSYESFLIGFVMWGVCGALQSGAKEALMYENLRHLGAVDRYASFAGRARACQTIAVLTAMLLAPTVFDGGGYTALGIASVAAGLATTAVALLLPEHRAPDAERGEGLAEYGRTLLSGLREVRRNRFVLYGVLAFAGVPAVWGSLEEYAALLSSTFAVTADVPYFVAALTGGITVGALLAGRASRLAWRRLALGLAAGAAVLTSGALVGGVWGYVAIIPAFAVFNAIGIVAETRLQDAISGPARATVLSVGGLGMELLSIGFFASYAVTAELTSQNGGFAMGGAVYLVMAAAMLVIASAAKQRRMQ